MDLLREVLHFYFKYLILFRFTFCSPCYFIELLKSTNNIVLFSLDHYRLDNKMNYNP